MTWFSAVVLAGVVLVLLIVLALLLMRRRRLQSQRRRVPDGLEDLLGKVGRTFARARLELGQSSVKRMLTQLRLIRSAQHAFDRRLLFIGPPGSGKTRLLQQLSRNVRYAAASKDGSDWPCQLFRVGTALGIELSGRVLAEDNAKGEGGDAFQLALRRLKGLFPDCTVDGVALTLSCERQLLNQELGDCQEVAQTLRKRLDNIREQFGVRAPVYVLLTECEALPGFAQYCQRLGERRHQILGWSNPESGVTDDPPDWVTQAFQSVTTELTHEQIQRLSIEPFAGDSDEYFVFPATLASCEKTLRCFMDEIFRERAEEAPQLRGIYFVGESADAHEEAVRSPTVLTQLEQPNTTSGGRTSGGMAPIPVSPSGAVPAGTLRAPSDPSASRFPLLQPAKLRGGVGIGSISFATDLFNGLILKESHIAEPTEKAVRRCNRIILGWRIGVLAACAIYLVALVWESVVISGRVNTLRPALQQIQSSLNEQAELFSNSQQIQSSLKGQAGPAVTVEREYEMRQLAGKLLDALSNVTAQRLFLVTAPLTWPWPIHANVTRALGVGHQRIVLPTYRQMLNSESRFPAPTDGSQFEFDQKLEDTKEYKDANGWILHLERLELSVREFNCMLGIADGACTGFDNLRSIVDLSKNLLNQDLNASFPNRMRAFAQAFEHPEGEKPVDIKVLSSQLKTATAEVVERLNTRAFELASQPMQSDIDLLSNALKTLDSSSNAKDLEIEDLRAMSKAIGELDDGLKKPKVSWVASGTALSPTGHDAVELGRIDPRLKLTHCLDLLTPIGNYDAYRALLDRLSRLEFLGGTSLSQDKACVFVERLASMKKWRDLTLAQNLSLLKRDREGVPPQMALSPKIVDLKKPTDALLSKEFMKGDPSSPPPLDFKDVRIRWDVDPLKSAVRLIKEYEEWLGDSTFVKSLPSDFQYKPRELARRMVSDSTMRLVGQAAHLEPIVSAINPPEDVLKSDTDSLAAANSSLIEILASLRRLRLDDPRGKIRDAVNLQGEYLLKTLKRSLADAQLYNANFSKWNEEREPKPIAFRAFSVADAGQLDDYLVKERTTRAVKYVGDFAEPVVTLMLSPEVNYQSRSGEADVNYWFRNVKAVRGYENKQAGNSLVELERFIATDLAGIRNHHDCTKYLSSTAGKQAPINAQGGESRPQIASVSTGASEDDFFTRHRHELRARLEMVCGTKSLTEYERRYRAIQRTFETYLSNHFPFATGLSVEDADPNYVRVLLRNAHDLWSDYKDALVDATDAQTAKQRDCLSQLDAVHNFMAPLWPRSESSEGFINVNVKFRVNATHEVAGNQIADWSLQLGETRLHRGDKKTSEHWFIGDPVRASFRWAKDGPSLPEPGKGITVDGLTATAGLEGTWALLRLIATYRVRSTDLGVQSENATLLRFQIATHKNEEGGLLDLMSGANAQLYIALTLSGEKDVILHYPIFPTSCPPIEHDPDESNRAYETTSSYSASR